MPLAPQLDYKTDPYFGDTAVGQSPDNRYDKNLTPQSRFRVPERGNEWSGPGYRLMLWSCRINASRTVAKTHGPGGDCVTAPCRGFNFGRPGYGQWRRGEGWRQG